MWIRVLDVSLLGLTLYLVGQLAIRRKTPLPPGPPGLPVIGNLLNIPTHAPYKAMGGMSRKYGPLIYLNLVGTALIVLNSRQVASDLLEKKSAITSNRTYLTMACDLVGWGKFTGLLQYGDRYRKHRKFFHRQIGTKNSLEAFYPAEEAEAKQFLRNLLKSPEDLIAHSQRMAGSIILKISYGYSVKEDGDQFVEMANRAVENLTMVTTPGRFIVDMLPILRYLPEWFPGGGFHKDARRWRTMLDTAVDTPYEFVLEHVAKGDAIPSFMSRQLQAGVTPEDEKILKWASFAMYLGGSDTISSAISAFFLAMTIYPDVRKNAQMEIDAVVGHERLPTFKDRAALPYVNAICAEVLRWHAVAAVTIHVSTQDIIYGEYLIPKGSFLLPNIWFMLSDPETYPDPDVFDPERFLGGNPQPDPREVCFGWGRRSCPDVLRCVENGVECVPSYDVVEGNSRHVKPFKCRIIPRSKKAQDLLQA